MRRGRFTLGVKDYIDKPVTADKLKNALTRIKMNGRRLVMRIIVRHRLIARNFRNWKEL